MASGPYSTYRSEDAQFQFLAIDCGTVLEGFNGDRFFFDFDAANMSASAICVYIALFAFGKSPAIDHRQLSRYPVKDEFGWLNSRGIGSMRHRANIRTLGSRKERILTILRIGWEHKNRSRNFRFRHRVIRHPLLCSSGILRRRGGNNGLNRQIGAKSHQ